MGLWRRTVRFGFRLLYNELAWAYDAIAWGVSAGEWHAWQRAAITALNLPAGGRILEVAHGTGTLHADLLAADYECIGVDLSQAMGRVAQRKLIRLGRSPNLARASASALPCAADAFDGLVCTFPSDFLIQPMVLAEFRRVLRADARAAIVLHGVLLRGWWRPLLDVLFRITGQGSIRQENVPETLDAPYARLITLFAQAGLTCEIRPVMTPRGYAVVAVAGRMPQKMG